MICRFFLRKWRRLGPVKPDRPLKGWVVGSGPTRNECLEFDLTEEEIPRVLEELKMRPFQEFWMWCVVPAEPAPEKCFCCKGPFSVSTGPLMGWQKTPFCGRCMHEFMDWLRGHTRLRVTLHHSGKPKKSIRFYDHAGPLPPVAIGSVGVVE